MLPRILNASGASRDTEVSLLLVGRRRMRALNRCYRGVDASTDVLSFAQCEGAPTPTGSSLLGDIVICLPVAVARARRWGWPLADELAVLLTHGTLHLLGFDHRAPAAARAMAEAEMCVLAAIGRDPERTLVGRNLA